MQLCSGDSISRVNPIACLQSQAYSEASATLWRVRHPVAEKTQKFSKTRVLRFVATLIGDCFASGSSSREFYSDYLATPISTHLRVELLVTKNTQTNFSKFFSWGFWRLVRDLFQLQKSRVLHFKDSFQKLFNFPSFILSVHCLARSSLSQTHRVSLKNTPFSSSSLLQT